jgi:hypothetical protein
MAAMVCLCVCVNSAIAVSDGVSAALGPQKRVLRPGCECYPPRQTDIPGKAYHIGVTNVKI